MFFGKKVKELRLKYANKGLRNFSIDMGMSGVEYSNMERGLTSPPTEEKWIHTLCEKLKVPSKEKAELYIEWNKPFVMQLMDESVFIVHALMEDGTSADAQKLHEVSEYMRNISIEHNKKAREYNETEF